MTIYFDISKSFFQQHEVHLLNKKFFPLINDKLSGNNLYFELGFIDEFSQFNYPSQFFFEKIKGLLSVNENIYSEELERKNEKIKKEKEEIYTKLDTSNPSILRISTSIKNIEDEEKRTIIHELPFCQVHFIDSNLIETKKNMFRIILKMKMEKKNNISSQLFQYKIHQICLLLFDFFNLKTI